MFNILINQEKLNYRVNNLVTSVLRCLCLRSTKSLRSKNSESDRLELMLRHGERKLTRDLDIVNLIDMIKGYRCIRKVLFDRNLLFSSNSSVETF